MTPRPSGPGPGQGNRAQLARQRQAAERRRRRRVQLGIIGGVAIVVIAMVATAILLGRRAEPGGSPQVSTTVTVNGATVPFAVAGSAVRLGPAEAKAQVDLWVDYSCPHCQEFEAANSAVLAQLIARGDVSVSYHNIQIVTDYGTQAGAAAACVAALDPGRWLTVNSSLYANHSSATDGWTLGQFATFAGEQGVNEEAQSCISAGRYPGWIAANTAEAASRGVSGTPTLFLNGQSSDLLSGPALYAKVAGLAGG